MYVNREEYLILAAYVGALAHLLTETGDCWNRAIGVRSSSAEATSPGISAFEVGHGPGQTCPVDDRYLTRHTRDGAGQPAGRCARRPMGGCLDPTRIQELQ